MQYTWILLKSWSAIFESYDTAHT